MTKVPDRLYVDKEDIKLYKFLQNEELFNGRENKDLFIIAIAFGYNNGLRKKIERREGFVRTEYLKEEDWALIYSIALDIGPIEILEDDKMIFEVIEEYAKGGIELIVDKIEKTQFGSFEKKFEKELYEIYNKLKI